MFNSVDREIYSAHKSNVKMSTIVGILPFISTINTTSERLKQTASLFVGILVFMSS